MSKFKVKFQLEKLNLEVEGERASVPEISEAIQKHLSGLLAAPAALAGGSIPGDAGEKATKVIDVSSSRKGRRRFRNSTKTQSDGQAVTVDFKHDPAKWGNPQQTWTTAQKSMWLLFVTKNESGIRELSASGITTLFNKHFRQSGAIIRNNVSRDLGKCKSKVPPWVGEDASKDPSMWYLTDEGDKIARQLVAEATGTAACANGAD